jgi:hypothetical protein
VLGRSRRPDVAQFRRSQIEKEILDHLGPHITTEDIIYKSPNFKICLHDAYVQQSILSNTVLRTTEFDLDLQPWSKEHELAQLPCIPGRKSTQNSAPLTNILMDYTAIISFNT